MPDRVEKLRMTLADLERELGEIDSLDDASRLRLQEVADEISEVLRKNEVAAASGNNKIKEPHGVRERVIDSLEHFRVQHPTLAGILERLVDGLGQLGI